MENIKREVNIHAAIELQNEDLLRRIIDSGCDVEENRETWHPYWKLWWEIIGKWLIYYLRLVQMSLPPATWTIMSFSRNHCKMHYHKRLCVLLKKEVYSLALMDTKSSNALSPRGQSWTWLNSFQHMYTSPLQNACTTRLWPVIMDLIEAGSRVHINGPRDMMPLATAVDLSNGFENSCLYTRTSRRKALDLLSFGWDFQAVTYNY